MRYKLDMMQPTLLAYSSRISTQANKTVFKTSNESEIVLVKAKTAPQIVSSVPKCARNRTNPLDTLNGLAHMSSAQSEYPRSSGEPVILILEDTKSSGSAWPVIGRRLPNKSAPDNSSALVSGRRSNRIGRQLATSNREEARQFVHPTQLLALDRSKRTKSHEDEERKRDIIYPISVCASGQMEHESVNWSGSCCCYQVPFDSLACLDQPRIHLHPPPIGICQVSNVSGQAQVCCAQLSDCCSGPSMNNDESKSNELNGIIRYNQQHRACQQIETKAKNRNKTNSVIKSVAIRSSSCSERRPNETGERKQLRNSRRCRTDRNKNDLNEKLLISTCCLGPTKASTRPASKVRKECSNLDRREEEHSVACIYDSLAAELKAKLGDPKLAPILLPPKDYDTICRQQGKLNGIESRRSTNPQLVGQVGSKWQLNEESDLKGVAVTSGEGVSGPIIRRLDRSRSNSSSGLGSVSVNLNSSISPISSRLSSNDEIDSSRQAEEGTQMRRRRRGINDNDNDNGNDNDIHLHVHKQDESMSAHASDSGHSGSGSGSGHFPEAETIKIILNKTNKTKFNQRIEDKISDRGQGVSGSHNPSKVSSGILWNGRVEVPLKVNCDKEGGQVYLATKQIIY